MLRVAVEGFDIKGCSLQQEDETCNFVPPAWSRVVRSTKEKEGKDRR